MHLFQTLELLFRLLEDFFRHLGCLDAAPEFRHLFGPLVQFAEFLLNRLELFAQKVFALGLIHLALGLSLDLLLH